MRNRNHVDTSTRIRTRRQAAAFAAVAASHALLAAFSAAYFAREAPVATPARLRMAFVVPAPEAAVIEPVANIPPPLSSAPKTKPRPATKKPAATMPRIPIPPLEPESVDTSDPAPDAPAVVEPAPAAITQAADSVPAPLVAPIFEADYLNNPKPVYPPAARRLRLQGTVIVRVTVTTQGKPANVHVVTSSGIPILDQAALAAVKTWSFVPARRGIETVNADVDVPVRFSLN